MPLPIANKRRHAKSLPTNAFSVDFLDDFLVGLRVAFFLLFGLVFLVFAFGAVFAILCFRVARELCGCALEL